MKLSQNIYFKDFKYKKVKKKILNFLKEILSQENQIIISLGNSYKDSYGKKLIKKLQKFFSVNLIGIGGSSLGSKAIYNFLGHKVKKKFIFIDSLNQFDIKTKKDTLNLIISKSGNTLETIANINFYTKKNQKNIFITEDKKSYLTNLAKKLKAEIISHNNYIGGRYSVLSEVGMLPAELMGLNSSKFRQLNSLIKKKSFTNLFVSNVSNILDLIKRKKTNSIILNYDDSSYDLFFWYQQLVAESLGKKSKGLLPIISNMPRDNHSMMQLYLDGPKNNFYTLFFVKENSSKKINNIEMLNTHSYLKNKSINSIKQAQFDATQRVFKKKNIPFRSFFISKKDEKTLGELFSFFILETILLGKAMDINPYDQPSVELIKVETRKFF